MTDDEKRLRRNKWSREWRQRNPVKALALKESWRERNPEKMSALRRRYHRKRKYGVTDEQFQILMKACNGKCQICTRYFSEDFQPCVDHNHITGEVRGLLCTPCNSGIGYLGDDPKMLQRVVAYLKK